MNPRSLKAWTAIVASAVLAIAAAGCGDDSDAPPEDAQESFRIPDSLLTPLEGYGLTVDKYHPVNGGVMANEVIEIRYPPSEIARAIAVKVFGDALDAYRTVTGELGEPAEGRVYIIGAKDLDEYRFLTTKEWWYYAVIQGDTIYSEPFDIMLKRYDPISERTFARIGYTQRMAQMALERMTRGRIPVWLKEAIASHTADERNILRVQIEQFRKSLVGYSPSLEEIEHNIAVSNDKALARASYFMAYRMLENLLDEHTMEDVMAFVRALGEGRTLDEASIENFGIAYVELAPSLVPEDLFEGAGEVVQPVDVRKEQHEGHDHE